MNEDYREDELINVMLSRKDLKVLQSVIQREEAYDWFTTRLKNYWIWAVAGGVLVILGVVEKFGYLK